MKRCPFSWKACKDDCVLFRKGVRYYDDPTKKPIAFEECALNIATDCLENLITRSIGQQKAQEQTRNETAQIKELFFRAAAQRQLDAIVEERAVQLEQKKPIMCEDVIEVRDNNATSTGS